MYPKKPPTGVMKPQSNCKNGRLGRSSPTEAPVQPTNLITAHTVPALFCLSPEVLARSIQEPEKQNSIFAKVLEFPGLVVSIQTIRKGLQASTTFVVSICRESTKRETSSPRHPKRGRDAWAWADAHGCTQASAAQALLPQQPGWPLQLLALLIGLEKGK